MSEIWSNTDYPYMCLKDEALRLECAAAAGGAERQAGPGRRALPGVREVAQGESR